MIVEDDKIVASELYNLLTNSSYEATILTNFENALETILKSNSDLILLDVMLPKYDGFEVCQQIREYSDVPIIMLTAKGDDMDKILGLDYGADDYIIKPYNPTILLLRISNIFKRCEQKLDIIKFKNLIININKGIIKNNEKEVVLTKNEMIIFSYLLNNKERIVTRDELMTTLWNNDEYINDNALTVNISRLRTKLKELSEEEMIETRKGLGYILL